MTTPGFTGEASLAPARSVHRHLTQPEPPCRSVSPALMVAIPYGGLGAGVLEWPIVEPNCVQVCLPWWGGHCRWICY